MTRALRNLPLLFACSMLNLLCARGHAAEAAPSSVCVLRVAEDHDIRERENHFVEELSLALEGVRLVVEPSPAGFSAMALADQLAWVRARAAKPPHAATLWLSFVGDTVLLHLVALQTERALVRVIRIKERPAFEAELALLAKELLGEAYLFAPSASVSAPVRETVSETRRKTSQASAPHSLEVLAAGEATAAFRGGVGPRTQLGASLGLGVRSVRQLWLGFSTYGLSGPSGEPAGTVLRGRELGLSLNADYRSALGPFELGPVLRLTVAQRHMQAKPETGEGRTVRTLSSRSALGARAALRVATSTCAWLELTLGVRGARAAIRRASDDTVVARSALFDAGLRLGVTLQFQ